MTRQSSILLLLTVLLGSSHSFTLPTNIRSVGSSSSLLPSILDKKSIEEKYYDDEVCAPTTISTRQQSVLVQQEHQATVEWGPYVPTMYERVLCAYYSLAVTICGTIRRWPLDTLRTLKVTWPLIAFQLVLHRYSSWNVSVSTELFCGLLIIQLLPSTQRVCKGVFYAICAGFTLGHTWKQKMAYIHCALPWWITNKLSDGVGDVNVLLHVCSDKVIQKGIQDHMQARTLNPSDIPAEDYLTQMSDFGGSYVTQLYLFGTRHVERHSKMHKTVSFVAHILDDYADRKEDKITGEFNYFNDHPLAEVKTIDYWIAEMHEAREYFKQLNDVAMVQFIDGSCAVATLFHPGVYQLVYKNPDFEFGSPLEPALVALFQRFNTNSLT